MIASNVAPQIRHAFKAEELRDIAGVASGVAAGTLVWLVLLSLVRLRF
jgi:hypothetical protein